MPFSDRNVVGINLDRQHPDSRTYGFAMDLRRLKKLAARATYEGQGVNECPSDVPSIWRSNQ